MQHTSQVKAYRGTQLSMSAHLICCSAHQPCKTILASDSTWRTTPIRIRCVLMTSEPRKQKHQRMPLTHSLGDISDASGATSCQCPASRLRGAAHSSTHSGPLSYQNSSGGSSTMKQFLVIHPWSVAEIPAFSGSKSLQHTMSGTL